MKRAQNYMAQSLVIVPMDQLLEGSPSLVMPKPGELITGKVLSMDKKSIMVDLNGILTGIIAGKETKDTLDTIKTLKLGAEVTACVLESENDEGLVVLSLRKASQEKTWARFIKAFDENASFKVKPIEANKKYGASFLSTSKKPTTAPKINKKAPLFPLK